MYSVSGYAKMIADNIRMEAYRRALSRAVKPGCVVLDIGTGLGVMALLACQLGARRVYAIEPSDVIQVAQEIAGANGYAERITFIQDYSLRVDLPEPVDVIVSDLRGVLPLLQRHLPSIIDARNRFLAPSGRLIPQQDHIWAALVDAPELYCRRTHPWQDNDYGIDLSAPRKLLSNTIEKGIVRTDQLLTAPQVWATLDYHSIANADVGQEMTWKIDRAGTAHGLSLWFDTILGEDAGFSNAPGLPELIYGSLFLPFTAPLRLAAGDLMLVRLTADLVQDDYIWRWETTVLDQGDQRRVKVAYNQSSFFGMPLSLPQLRKRAAGFTPGLNQEGEIDRQILEMMRGGCSLGEIARQTREKFPDRFASENEALTRAGELSLKYSQ